MRLIMRAHYYLVRLLATISGCCIVFLIVAIGAEAIIRSLRLGFIPGIIDLSEYALFLIAILSAPWLFSINKHIRVDIVLTQLRGRSRLWADSLINLVIFLVAAVILYYSSQVLMESWTRGEIIYRELEIPDWWLQWQIPLAMLLIGIESLQRVFWPASAYTPDTPTKWDFDDPDMSVSDGIGG